MIAEIREYRDKQAARFGYDVGALHRHYQALHEASGRPSVQFPPRLLETDSAPEQSNAPEADDASDAGTQ